MASNSAWAGGINNRANEKSVPDGFVRDLVNLDPLVGGDLGLRSGYEQQYSATAARGALSLGSKILFADGSDLISFDTQTGTGTTLAQIAQSGRFLGAVLNNELFFCTATEVLRYDGATLRQWGVSTVTSQPVPGVIAGSLRAGTYQAAMTLISPNGEEGGTVNPIQITLADNSGMAFDAPALPAGHRYRLYTAPVNSETLYLQYEGVDGCSVQTMGDFTARLQTLNLREPVGGDYMTTLGSVVMVAQGGTLWHTLAMSPHLLDMSRSFFQYPAAITALLRVDGGVFVCADKTYFLQAPESGDVVQSTKLEYGAIPGTGVILPDGRASWMTQYGLAVGAFDGSVTLLSQTNFVPEMAQSGASGVIDHNGNQMVVTTMSGQKGPNPLAASDYYEAEIFTP